MSQFASNKCGGCGNPVGEGGLTIPGINNKFHKECFNCCECKEPIKGSFRKQGNLPLCLQCSEKPPPSSQPSTRNCGAPKCIQPAGLSGYCGLHAASRAAPVDRQPYGDDKKMCGSAGCNDVAGLSGYCSIHLNRGGRRSVVGHMAEDRERKMCGAAGCSEAAGPSGYCGVHGVTTRRSIVSSTALKTEQRVCGAPACTSAAGLSGYCSLHSAPSAGRRSVISATAVQQQQGQRMCNAAGCSTMAGPTGYCGVHAAVPQRKPSTTTNMNANNAPPVTSGYYAEQKLCGAQGCTSPAGLSGYCSSHNAAPRKNSFNKNMSAIPGIVAPPESKMCAAAGCSTTAGLSGYCGVHAIVTPRKASSAGSPISSNPTSSTNSSTSGGGAYAAEVKLCGSTGCTLPAGLSGYCSSHNAAPRRNSFNSNIHNLPPVSLSGRRGSFGSNTTSILSPTMCEAAGCTLNAGPSGYCGMHDSGAPQRRTSGVVGFKTCGAPGCKGDAGLSGYCSQHAAARAAPTTKPVEETRKYCGFAECKEPAGLSGYCATHNQAKRRSIFDKPSAEEANNSPDKERRSSAIGGGRCKEPGCKSLGSKNGFCMLHQRLHDSELDNA